ncbi:MAG: primosomal protein N' [Gammaproteobacteria bacterium]
MRAVLRKPGRPVSGVVQVAVPVPLRRLFDYRWEGERLAPGARVRAPFGRRELVGVVVSNHPASAPRRLKLISEALDRDNLFGDALLELLLWAARYYHHPLGEALQAALPPALRRGAPPHDPTRRRCVRAMGVAPDFARAELQARIYRHLLGAGWVEAAALKRQFPGCDGALRRLLQKGLVEDALRPCRPDLPALSAPPRVAQFELNPQQRAAADALAASDGFASFLLHGVTGSGKTEVYLEAAERCVSAGRQALFLVPEIALTPQLVERVRARLGDAVCVLHSALPAEQRYRAWWRAREGEAAAVLGTRSAVFTPLKSPGLILVDEEHDISYKQQDGFRYHARDLAIKRASIEGVAVVLGSATPSMETRHNALAGRHRLLTLDRRGGPAALPRIDFIDLARHRPVEGVSAPLLRALRRQLEKREQSIVFLNRRGFAPIAQCVQCGWRAGCERCDARLTYHRDAEEFRCHHCGIAGRAEMRCGDCGKKLFLIGAGTQRLERYLRQKFPAARISRLDRDQVAGQAHLARELEAIRRGETDIIIGTQLISKGHDFAGVTLVGVVNSDQGLHSADFRAPEYLFQQLTQVSGRAGRARAPGEVLIQTAHPRHHTLQTMRAHDFEGFAVRCLDERRAAGYPPFSHIALWRAEAARPGAALQFLRHAAELGRRLCAKCDARHVQILDAVAAPMEKLAGRHRAQLMVRSARRGPLHRLLRGWCEALETDAKSRRARWSLDVDPVEMF